MTIDLNERNTRIYFLHFDEVFSENHDYFLFCIYKLYGQKMRKYVTLLCLVGRTNQSNIANDLKVPAFGYESNTKQVLLDNKTM